MNQRHDVFAEAKVNYTVHQTCRKLKPFRQQIWRSKFPQRGKIKCPYYNIWISANVLKFSASTARLLGSFCMSAVHLTLLHFTSYLFSYCHLWYMYNASNEVFDFSEMNPFPVNFWFWTFGSVLYTRYDQKRHFYCSLERI